MQVEVSDDILTITELSRLKLKTGVYSVSRKESVFVKVGTGGFEATAAALKYEKLCLEHLHGALSHLEEADSMISPKPIGVGLDRSGSHFIAIEYLNLSAKTGLAGKLGRALALLHKNSGESNTYGFYGFPLNGQCGAFPQSNNIEQHDLTWCEFWERFRLKPQTLSISKQYPNLKTLLEKLNKLSENLHIILSNSLDVPKCLLHGDLWSGNWGGIMQEDSAIPAIFDPASYYGHNEADLGIADLFGMDQEFYTSYFAIMPAKPDYQKRRVLYELHHALNHLNIFGISYAETALKLVSRLLSSYHIK